MSNLNPTTVAYIQSLIAPRALEIRAQPTLETLVQWVDHVLPESLKPLGVTLSDKGMSDNLATAQADLIQALGDVLAQSALDFDDSHILPWDIIDGIYDRETEMVTIAEFLGVEEVDFHDIVTLPITVTVDGQRELQSLSKLEALGLVLFSRVSGHDFGLEMYGTPLSNFDTMAELDRFVEEAPGEMGYHLTIANQTYVLHCQQSFDAFMAGFNQGAQWAGVEDGSLVERCLYVRGGLRSAGEYSAQYCEMIF